MSFYNNYPKATTAAQKKAKAIKSTEKLTKKNPDISPVIISGNKIAKTWWGISWNNNLESYSDYSNRIGRGRSYVRNGAVLDLQITSGNISALVQGSRAKPYKVDITIKSLNDSIWESITKACEGEIDSLQELIDGKFPKVLSDMFTIQGKGLFPSPKEISFECSCPDWANMCKHVAAVLYGVGARLDNNPTLFFVLRNVEIDDLISDTINNKSNSLIEKSKTKSGRVIEDTDISNLFGIDMEYDLKTIEDDLKTDKK